MIILFGIFFFVGSEMVRKSNASGQQLEEAKTINKSLSALGQVRIELKPLDCTKNKKEGRIRQ